MDYSNNFEVSMRPDKSNFKFSQALYGTFPPESRSLQQSATHDSVPPFEIPLEVRQKLRDLALDMQNHLYSGDHLDGLKVLNRSAKKDSYTISVGNGWSVGVHILFADMDI